MKSNNPNNEKSPDQGQQATVLIIEDDPYIRHSVRRFLDSCNFSVLEAADGAEGLQLFSLHQPDIIITDLRMPRVDGLEVLARVQKESPETPIVILSGMGTMEDVINALRLGAWDYLTKPISSMKILQHAVDKALERACLIRENKQHQQRLELEVEKRTRELRTREQDLKTALVGIVDVVAVMVEKRDPYTAGHEQRVAELARAIGWEMGLDDARCEGLHLAAFIHDLGKVAIPSEILSKPGRLTAIEYSLIQTHAQVGFDILSRASVEFPWPIPLMVHQHHERLDGSGYPYGLQGDDILMESRIIGVADVVEAMASHRPYRPALGTEKALAEIKRGRGSSYEPAAVDACLHLFTSKKFAFAQ